MKQIGIIKKFQYAARGVGYLWQHELSWRWQVLAAVIVQLVAWYLELNAVIWGLLTLTSVSVLAAEAFNTALEKLLDIVEPRLSAQVAILKNLLAAAVLLIVIGAVVVAIVVVI